MKRIIEHTTDGSTTLFVPELDEHYHSIKGARTEAQHIFVNMGLQHVTANPVRLLEIGFGTGLNALLTLQEAEHSKRKVEYTGLELYPLEWQTIEQLHYSDSTLFRQLHTIPWETSCEITPFFSLTKIQADFTLLKEKPTLQGFDVIYFDAFAPEKQPEMWSQELFNHLYHIINSGGVLTTYCAKGIVRRMLQQSGFTVERLSGPPNGKREILRATKS